MFFSFFLFNRERENEKVDEQNVNDEENCTKNDSKIKFQFLMMESFFITQRNCLSLKNKKIKNLYELVFKARGEVIRT